jgi:hypothetical protein
MGDVVVDSIRRADDRAVLGSDIQLAFGNVFVAES